MIAGAGTVDLAAANNPYTGGTTIDSGVLELANAVDAGSGGIAFTSSASAIRLDAGANFANTISGFRGSDEIDFSQVGYATGDHAVANANGNVAIETTSGQTVATFNVTGPYQSANFKVAADASGHILVAYVNVTSYLNVSNAADLSNDIAAIDFASQLDGGNGTNYVITLAAGAALTESADISAINLTGNDTLTINVQNGQRAILDGADAYRGLFAYSGTTTIENLTVENCVAMGRGGAAGGGGGAGLGGGLFVADDSAGRVGPCTRRAQQRRLNRQLGRRCVGSYGGGQRPRRRWWARRRRRRRGRFRRRWGGPQGRGRRGRSRRRRGPRHRTCG